MAKCSLEMVVGVKKCCCFDPRLREESVFADQAGVKVLASGASYLEQRRSGSNQLAVEVAFGYQSQQDQFRCRLKIQSTSR